MSLHYAARGLAGLLTPQANTTVEPEFAILMPPGHAHLAARMVSRSEDMDTRLVEYLRDAGRTVAQFANAPLTSLALACTGSSYLVGRAEEQRLLESLVRDFRTPAFTAATAIVDCLAQLRARRIALVSPYPEALTRASTDYWVSHGLTVVRVARALPADASGPVPFHPIYALGADAAGRMLDGLGALDDVDAVLMLGTGLPTLEPLLHANRACRGAPVLSSMLCLAWKAVDVAEPGAWPLADWLAGTHWAARLALARGATEGRVP